MQYKGTLKKRLLALVLVVGVLMTSIGINVYAAEVTPQESAITNAVEWLNSVKANGIWGDSNLVNETCEVLQVFNMLDIDTNVSDAYSWLDKNGYAANNDSLSRYIAINTANNDALTKLLGNQNEDGGFGLTSDYTSDTLDSLLAMEALMNTEDKCQDEVELLISYLISVQNEDGGWGNNRKSGSNAVFTARIADAIFNYTFQNFLQADAVTDSLEKAAAYLKNIDYNDFSDENIKQSLYVYNFLCDYSKIADSTEFIQNLITVQNENGSFYEDINTTCLVIKILKSVQRRAQMTTEIKGMNLSSNVTSVYVGNKTDAILTANLSYFTRKDCTYTIKTEVFDGQTVMTSNLVNAQLSKYTNSLEKEVITFVIDEKVEKDLVIKSTLYDDKGNIITEANQKISVKSKFINTDVLLIQTVRPWSTDANEAVLNSLGVSYDKMTADQALNVDLLSYRVIIVANDQTTGVYNSIAKLKTQLESFVNNGGTMLYGVCDGGWSSGTSSPYIPGDVKVARLYSYPNYIVDDKHPIVTALYSDGVKLTNSDLYHNYASHTYLVPESLPKNANIILNAGENYPTLAEYHIGKGLVIASCLTWEHAYTYSSNYGKKAMDDLFLYALNMTYEAIEDEPGTVSSTVSTDKNSYNAGETIQISIKSELSSFRRQVHGVLSITDKNNVLITKIDSDINENMIVGIPVNYNNQWKVENLIAGTYKVRIEWDDNGEKVGGGEREFEILPKGGVSNQVATDKAEYSPNENVNITETIKNTSDNSVLKDLSIKIAIKDAEGTIMWEQTNSLNEILQNGSSVLKSSWNTSKNASGDYTVTSEVYKDSIKLSENSAVFKIVSEIEGNIGVSGNLEILNKEIHPEDAVNMKYTINNTGNVNLNNITARIRIVEVSTGSVIDTITDQTSIDVSSNYTSEKTWTHEPLERGTYMVVLDAIISNDKEVPLGSGYIKVEKPYETTISQVIRPRVLVWSESQSNTDLAKKTLGGMQVYYKTVNTREAFMAELRTGKYNLYMLLDSKKPLTGNDDKELAAEVAAGKGIIASRDANGDNLKNLGLFGVKFNGSTTPHDYTVDFPADSVFGQLKMTGTGKAQNVTLNGGQQLAVLNSKKGISPGVVTYKYQNGKTLLFTFDIGSCSGDIESVLKKAVELTVPESEVGNGYAELEIKVKAYTAIGAEIRLNIPEGAEIVWLSPDANAWSFDTAKGREYTFRFILKLPQEAGQYPVSVNSYYETSTGMIKFDSVEVIISR